MIEIIIITCPSSLFDFQKIFLLVFSLHFVRGIWSCTPNTKWSILFTSTVHSNPFWDSVLAMIFIVDRTGISCKFTQIVCKYVAWGEQARLPMIQFADNAHGFIERRNCSSLQLLKQVLVHACIWSLKGELWKEFSDIPILNEIPTIGQHTMLTNVLYQCLPLIWYPFWPYLIACLYIIMKWWAEKLIKKSKSSLKVIFFRYFGSHLCI